MYSETAETTISLTVTVINLCKRISGTNLLKKMEMCRCFFLLLMEMQFHGLVSKTSEQLNLLWSDKGMVSENGLEFKRSVGSSLVVNDFLKLSKVSNE